MIIVPHIPKTGGSSFLMYLRQVFGPRLHHEVDFRLRHSRGWRRWLADPHRRVPAGTECIFGHFLATTYRQTFPRARLATWLRDPVERVASNYYYFLRLADPGLPIYRRIVDNKLSLADFAELPNMRDRQARFLDDCPLRTFAFVGLTEQYSLGLRLFARVFDCSDPTDVFQDKRNPARSGAHYELEPGLRSHIRDLNQGDEALYCEAKECFAELCARHGIIAKPPALRQSSRRSD